MSVAKTLIIPKIENGIVIDHIPAGLGVKVLEILQNAPEMQGVIITLGLNYASGKLVSKDLIKVFSREISDQTLDQLSLVVPGVSIKRVTDFEVDKRFSLEPPEQIVGIACCRNPNCVTRHEADAITRFSRISTSTRRYRCAFCERVFLVSELEIDL